MVPQPSMSNGPTKKQPKSISSFLGGATAGCISTIILQPFDVVKTRMQMSSAFNRSVHLHSALSIQPNASAFATVRSIIQQDRITGLWRGVTPSIMRNTMGVGIYFMALNAITDYLADPDGTLSSNAILTAGGIARASACTLLCPLSVVKTRMETIEYSIKYSGVGHALQTIARTEGYGALFSGLFPAIIRDVPYSSMYMLLYLQAREALGKVVGLQSTKSSIVTAGTNSSNVTLNTNSAASSTNSDSEGTFKSMNPANLTRAVNFVSGAIGGGLATLLTQPQDVVKTRMQLSQRSKDGSPTRYRSISEAMRRVFNEEGFYGFFRGSSPRFFKRIFGSAITWMVFEEISPYYRKLLTRQKDKE